MKFLVPIGGFSDDRFGVITSPRTKGIPRGISAGLQWGADLGCISGPKFIKRYDPETADQWLQTMIPYRETCLFILAPDHWGNARETLRDFPRIHISGFPVGYACQDGQEDLDYPSPDSWSALFVGGSDKWRAGPGAIRCIMRAQDLGKHIHIGRINYKRRYDQFRSLSGSERFTCDGTRTRYEKDKALKDWGRYMESPKQFNMFVPRGDHSGESDNQ